MQAIETIPLFRTAVAVLAAQPAAAITQPTPAQSDEMDITDCVGATVDPETWVWLQAEVQRRYAGAWTLHAVQVGEGFRITSLTARPQ